MTTDELKAKRDQLQEQFNKNAEQAQTIEDEQKRLQGEYRLVESLIEENNDPAETVSAEPTLEAEDKKNGRGRN